MGFDTSDDASVYKLTDELAIVSTLDFFPPMVDDPYLFGQIAAANALSDVYAMGARVVSALNIVCFPEEEDPAILGEILRGGADKVKEAGAVLTGGHTIDDKLPKYGLAVTGLVHPDKIMRNNTCHVGDKIILTKPLGVGMITTCFKAGQASRESLDAAIESMKTLNKFAFEEASKYRIHSCTDVTGFGFLGHLNEMVNDSYSMKVDAGSVPYIPEAYRLAEEYLMTAGGLKNRKFLSGKTRFSNIPMPIEEILLDPQTSGGLLISVHPEDAQALLDELGGVCAIVAEVTRRGSCNIIIE